MSTDAQAEVIKSIIATATKAPAFDHDEAERRASSLPSQHTEVYLSRRFGGNVRGDTRETPLRRLQTRVVASTVTNARLLEDRLAEAFAHTSFDVAGTLVHFEYEGGGGSFEFDKATNRYHALTDWTFSV